MQLRPAVCFGIAPGGLEERRALVVVADRITLADLVQYGGPQIRQFLEAGGIGLMGNSSRRDSGDEAATMGTGSPIRASSAGELAFEAEEVYQGESAGSAYQRRTGWTAPAGSVIIPGWPEVLASNRNTLPQSLGDAIHGAGRTTAVLGNSDLWEEPHRPSALIAVDRWGKVDYGEVGRQVLVSKGKGLLTSETDPEAIIRSLAGLPPEVAVAVVDFGDMRRLDEHQNYALPEVVLAEKARIMAKLDLLLANIVSTQDMNRTLIYLVGLTPGREAAQQQNLLVPVATLGAGVSGGSLTSPTTRRWGLVSDLDLAPSILSFLGLPQPPEMVGRSWHTAAGKGVAGELLLLNERLAFLHGARPPLVRSYVALQIVALVLAVMALTLRSRMGRVMRTLVPWLFLFLAATPLTFLLLVPASQTDLAAFGLSAVLLGVLLTMAFIRLWPGSTGPWLLLGAVLVGVLLVDTATGARLQQLSVLGYDPMGGARYYGMGNEYMGILIGAALLTGGLALELLGGWGWFPAASAWILSLLLLAAPSYGANVGGTIAAVAAFSLAASLLSGMRVSWRSLLGIGTGTAVLIMLIGLWDSGRSIAVQSHLGRALGLVWDQGWSEAWEIAVRKLGTNIRLIRYTIWTRALLAGLAVLILALHYPVGRMETFTRRFPRLYCSFLALVGGGLVALAFNDSGIVAVSLMMVYGIAPLLSLLVASK